METKVNIDLTNFRMETRKWLEDNCPLSMREPTKEIGRASCRERV